MIESFYHFYFKYVIGRTCVYKLLNSTTITLKCTKSCIEIDFRPILEKQQRYNTNKVKHTTQYCKRPILAKKKNIVNGQFHNELDFSSVFIHQLLDQAKNTTNYLFCISNNFFFNLVNYYIIESDFGLFSFG